MHSDRGSCGIRSLKLAAFCFYAATVFVALGGFAIQPGGFAIDGAELQIRSGEMHYSRIPRPEWPARIAMAKAMGLNTISIYLFWNLHEPVQGRYDFEAGKDFPAFIDACKQAGMKVIVRPGPYVCAEWELGGIPGWVLAEPGVKLRSVSSKRHEPITPMPPMTADC